MNYIELGKLLQEARTALGLKQSDVAVKIGCTSANISSWERGKSKIDIDSFAELCSIYSLDFGKTLEKLSKPETDDNSILDVAEQTIIKKYRVLDGHGREAVNSILNIEYERCTSESEESNLIQLPKSLLKVSAGTGLRLDDEYNVWVNVPDTPTARQANIVIEVSGDSMEPMFSDGDNVLVRLIQDIDEGEIGIFSVNNDAFIKKKGSGELISLNPEYENIKINEFSDVRCFGKVLGKTEII